MIPVLKSLRVKILTPLFRYILESLKDNTGTAVTDSNNNEIETYKRVDNA